MKARALWAAFLVLGTVAMLAAPAPTRASHQFERHVWVVGNYIDAAPQGRSNFQHAIHIIWNDHNATTSGPTRAPTKRCPAGY